MKKSSGHLLFGIILLAVMVALSAILATALPKEANPSIDLSNNNRLVYTVDSSDEQLVKQTAEVLQRRLYSFGASDVEYTINGSQISLVFNKIEDTDNLRKNLTRTGQLTFRNSKNELQNSENCLNSLAPLAVGKSDDTTQLYFRIGDSEAMKNLYTTMLANQDTMLVVWVDYAEGQSYATENAKENPAYLAAASLNSNVTSDFYITTNKDYNELIDTVRVVNGGALPAAITENTFEAVTSRYGENALNGLLNSFWIALMCCGLLLVVKYRLAGLVNCAALFAFSTAALIASSWMNIRFSVELLALVLIGLFINLAVMLKIDNDFVANMATGRNANTSFVNALKANNTGLYEGYGFQFVLGILAYLAFNGTLGQYGVLSAILAVSGLLFVSAFNNLTIKHFIESNYFDKALLGLNEKAKAEKKLDISKLLSPTLVYLLSALALVGCGFFAFNNRADIKPVLYLLICLAAIAVVIALYNRLAKKAELSLPEIAAGFIALAGALSCLLISYGQSSYAGIALIVLGSTLILAAVTANSLKDGYKEISRGKLSDEKITDMSAEKVNELFGYLLLACGMIVALTIGAYMIGIQAAKCMMLAFGSCLIVLFAGLLLTAYCWLSNTLKNSGKPNKKKKQTSKKSKELTETTVFGINEMR